MIIGRNFGRRCDEGDSGDEEGEGDFECGKAQYCGWSVYLETVEFCKAIWFDLVHMCLVLI